MAGERIFRFFVHVRDMLQQCELRLVDPQLEELRTLCHGILPEPYDIYIYNAVVLDQEDLDSAIHVTLRPPKAMPRYNFIVPDEPMRVPVGMDVLDRETLRRRCLEIYPVDHTLIVSSCIIDEQEDLDEAMAGRHVAEGELIPLLLPAAPPQKPISISASTLPGSIVPPSTSGTQHQTPEPKRASGPSWSPGGPSSASG